MKMVPFKDQVVKVDPLQSVEWMLTAGERVSSDDLGRAVEASSGRPLPPNLLAKVALVLRSIPDKARRGRKERSRAQLDFLMEEVDRLFDELSAQFTEEDRRRRAEKKPRRSREERPPPISERVYTEILRRMSHEFPNRHWTMLRNLHSEWRNLTWEPPESGNEHPDDP